MEAKSQQILLNPSEISLFDDAAPSTSQVAQEIRHEEENKENSGPAPDHCTTLNNMQFAGSPNLYWEQHEMQQARPYEQKVFHNYEHFVPPQQYQMNVQCNSNMTNYPQQYSPPALQSQAQQSVLSQMLQQPLQQSMRQPMSMSLSPLAERKPAAPRKNNEGEESGKEKFAWTYPAMIAACLYNSRGPQKMERLYSFMESHFMARLVKKDNGTNTREGWRKCIRHTVVYGKQFQNYAPEKTTRGKMYSIRDDRLGEVLRMFQEKFEDLREDMSRPDLLERMVAGDLKDDQLPVVYSYDGISSELDQAIQSIDDADGSVGAVKPKRKRGPYKKTVNKQSAPQQMQSIPEHQPAQSPHLRSFLSAPLQYPPHMAMPQYMPQPQFGYPFNGYPPQQFMNQNFIMQEYQPQYARNTGTPPMTGGDRYTPNSQSGCSSVTDVSDEFDMNSARPSYIVDNSSALPSSARQSSALPSIDTLSAKSPYSNPQPEVPNQLPEDFLAFQSLEPSTDFTNI